MLDARVAEVRDATPEMREIRLRGPGMATLRCAPGAHLPVEIPGSPPEVRTYSVWSHVPAEASLTLRIALHAGAECHGVLETTGPDAELRPPTGSRTLPWVHRGRAPATGSLVLLDAVRSLSLPPRPGIAYVAGESVTCRAVLRHLLHERGWPRHVVRVQPHWKPGTPGLT